VRRLRSAAAATATGRRSARLEGFSLHADVAVPARRRDQLEKVCRYILRPPLAVERLPTRSGFSGPDLPMGEAMNQSMRVRALGAVLYEDFQLLDLYGPLEMFGFLAPEVRIVTVAEMPGPVASLPGVKTLADHGFERQVASRPSQALDRRGRSARFRPPGTVRTSRTWPDGSSKKNPRPPRRVLT
jgi:hypothetical protein